MRDINRIILHCSATPEGRGVTVDQIRSWHLSNGWDDIGYHFCVYADGSVHRGTSISQERIPTDTTKTQSEYAILVV